MARGRLPGYRKPRISAARACAASMLLVMIGANAATAKPPQTSPFGRLDITAARAALPATSTRGIAEASLLDTGHLGMRIFRAYRPIPMHVHRYSDTVLQVVNGSADISVADGEPFTVKMGDVMFWRANIPHAIVRIHQGPLDFLATDDPPRRTDDTVILRR